MRTRVITICIFFELMGLACLIGAVVAYAVLGEPAVLDGGVSWTLVTTGLVCGIPAVIYMIIYTWYLIRKRRKQVERLMAGEDPNVVLKGTPPSEVDKVMENIRIIRESQERDRLAQDEERRRLELEIRHMDEMLRQTQATMAEEYRKTNAEAMSAQAEYMRVQAEKMQRAYHEAFLQQQEALMKQNSPNYRKASPADVTASDSATSATYTHYSSPSIELGSTAPADDGFAPADEMPALPVAPKEEYDKLLTEQVRELTTARDSYAEMTQEQLEALARALAEDVIRDKGFMAPQEVEIMVKKHREELQEQKNAYADLTSEKIQMLAHERAVETLRSQGYMSPTQVNELLEAQKATAVAEIMTREQIEELAHKKALEIANEKMAASKEEMEALAFEMARQSTQMQIEQIAAEKERLEEERRLLDQKQIENNDFAKQQLESALLGKNQMDILQAEHLRVEAALREKELREQERLAKQKQYRENRLQIEFARRQLLSRPNIEKLIHKYFAEVAVCFFMDREDFKRKYGIAPYNRVVMQPSAKEGGEPTPKYLMTNTEDRLYRFSEVLVDVERFFMHPQLYAMYTELVNRRTPLVLISERLHHMYLQYHKKDFVRDYRHKPNFDNLLIVVSNHFTLRAVNFKEIFPPPYPFDIANFDDDLIVEFLSDANRQKAFETAFPHYAQMGFEDLYQALYVGFIVAIKDRLQPVDVLSAILKDTTRIAKLMSKQESAKAKTVRKREPKKSEKPEAPAEEITETIDDIFDKVPEEKPVDALKGIMDELPETPSNDLPSAPVEAQNPPTSNNASTGSPAQVATADIDDDDLFNINAASASASGIPSSPPGENPPANADTTW